MKIMAKQFKVAACLLATVMAVSCVDIRIPSPAQGQRKTGASVPYWKGVAPNGPNTFRFVVMSDRTGGHKPGAWEESISEINLIKPDFVICVGDLIEGYTTNLTELAQMQNEFDAMTRKLDAPFYYCPGNHDMSNPIMYTACVARYGVGGKPYYSFDYRNSHFVVMDTVSAFFDTNMIAHEIEWLAKDLRKARQADHVFLFYHVPQWKNTAIWPQMVKLLDPKKTTIFNGHWHSLGYGTPNGIPTYVLAATGADYADENSDQPEKMDREMGYFRMFAHVTVDRGNPTVAIIPLQEVLPGNYILQEFHEALCRSIVPVRPVALPLNGGSLTLLYSNALPTVCNVSVTWDAPDWTVAPASGQVSMAASALAEMKFVVTTTAAKPGRLTYSAVLATTNGAGKYVSSENRFSIPLYASMDVPRVAGISVDGNAKEWQGVPVLHMSGTNCLWAGHNLWHGEKDLAVDWRVARDADRLYVCADVTDDQIAIDGTNIWDNDAVEFYWDARLPKDQDGRRGASTGQLILGVPAEGASTVPHWEMGQHPVPQGLISTVRRHPGGYVCEFSVPLRELGCVMPAKVGDCINLELQIDDRDIHNGVPEIKHQCSSGQSGSFQSTIGYARGTFR